MPSQGRAQLVYQAGHASSILVTCSTSNRSLASEATLKRAGSGWARPQSAVGTVRSMATLLHLGSSADLTGSVSRRLTARFAGGWAALGHAIVRRDLFVDQPPH